MKTTSNPMIIIHSLPHDVLAYVKARYPKGIILDMIENDNLQGEPKYYDVDVVDEDTTHHLRFDKKGKFVHEEVEVGKSDSTDDAESLYNPNVIEPKEPSPTDSIIDEI